MQRLSGYHNLASDHEENAYSKPQERWDRDFKLFPGYGRNGSRQMQLRHSTRKPTGTHQRNINASVLLGALTTAAISAVIVIVLKIYDDLTNFSEHRKDICNTVTTGLSLALGLNFFNAFSNLAKTIRWKLLLETARDEEHVELMLGLHTFTNVIKLGWVSRFKRPVQAFMCFLWVLAFVVAVSMIGLTYEMVDGVSYNDTFLRSDGDPVCLDDFDNYLHQVTQQGLAHSYGDNSASKQDCGAYTGLEEVYNSKILYPYYCKRSETEPQFAYRFLEWNFDDTFRTYPTMTERIVTATSGQCIEYDTTNGQLVNDANGHLAAWNFTFRNESYIGSITIPAQLAALGGTTYIYRGPNIPQAETSWDCGHRRCMWMWAYRAREFNDPPGTPEKVYQCPITISEVSNATRSEHELPDNIARLAIASLGLQGRNSRDAERRWSQYNLFPAGDPWSVVDLPLWTVGSNLAEYAIRSISTMATQNPLLSVMGSTPTLGTHLNVKYHYLIPLMAGITFSHIALVVATMYLTRKLTIPRDTYIGSALLLQPLLAKEYSGIQSLEGYSFRPAEESENNSKHKYILTEHKHQWYQEQEASVELIER